MELDEGHITLATLQRLVPQGTVAGGCFAAWLPHPNAIPRDERRERFLSVQSNAGTQAVKVLLARLGLPSESEHGLATAPGGERLWPNGFVGSITYKATIVLAAAAATTKYVALGIDLEQIDGHEHELQQSIIAPEGIPQGVNPEVGTLLAFSAKEAAFKAQYPASKRMLDFSDVRLKWHAAPSQQPRASAHLPDGLLLEVTLSWSSPWIVSVAFLPR